MLTGELRNQIDSIWNDFWSGGLANPLQVIEQITYLIFIKRLDEMQELEERKATTLGKPIERRIVPEGKDEQGELYANLRWSRFKHFAGPEMFRIVDEQVFPFVRGAVAVTERRFPPPWSTALTPNCFIVRDANGQALSYVYFGA
jgi:type I restriction enzyme M protein